MQTKMTLPLDLYRPATLNELALWVTSPGFAEDALMLRVSAATLAKAVIAAYIERENVHTVTDSMTEEMEMAPSELTKRMREKYRAKQIGGGVFNRRPPGGGDVIALCDALDRIDRTALDLQRRSAPDPRNAEIDEQRRRAELADRNNITLREALAATVERLRITDGESQAYLDGCSALGVPPRTR